MISLGQLGQDVTDAMVRRPFARFDFPTSLKAGPGPWALNKSGAWFRVTKRAPGSKVVGVVYYPPLHPSVRKSIPEFNKTIPAEVRFADPQMRAANRAALQSNWRDLYFNISPRGSGPAGVGAGVAFEGTAEDYDTEGGNLYPELKPTDPKAAELVAWWGRRHAWDGVYGAPNQLTLNWLRVYTDADGYQRYKPWNRSELMEYFHRWMLARDNYVCGGDEVINLANQSMHEQARRQAAQPERDYTPHWVWHIGPISQCQPKSSSRRRKAVKKAAAIAAVVVGAVYLGPMIAGALKGTGAAAAAGTTGTAAATTATGLTVTGVTTKAGLALQAAKLASKGGAAAEVAATVASGVTLAQQAQEWIPKVVNVANNVRTVKAIVDGEIPPPPITLEGSSFKDYATSLAQQILEKELADKQETLSRAQADAARREIEQEIARLQYEARARLPAQGVVQYPTSALAPATQGIIAGEQTSAGDMTKMAMMALPVIAALFVMR